MKTRFRRLMRTRDLEFFALVPENEKETAFLLFYDERAQEKGLNNKINAFLISNIEPSEALFEDTSNFCADLLDSCSFSLVSLQIKEASDFPVDMPTVQDYIQNLLTLLKLDIVLPNIQQSDFNYLSQE